jgi:M6 family metalloprotease-like protein
LVACAIGTLAWAGPAHADAGVCSLTGSGLEGATDTSRYQVPGPTLLASMIFVDFPDHPAAGAETPPNSFGAGLTTRAEGYMGQVSYGKTQMDVQLGSSWLRMDHNAGDYNPSTFAGQRAYMQEAIQHADAAGFDFSGRQTVFVVASPTGGARPSTQAFSALSGEGISVDGTNVRWGATVGDDARYTNPFWPNYGSKVLSHETNHTFGLPDLYRAGVADFALSHQDAGPWDPMDWPGLGLHLLGWHKQKLGWLGPADLVCVNGEATAALSPIESSGGTKMLIAKTAPGVAYVAEVHAPTGYDNELVGCDDGGVLIYRVNADGGNAFANGVAPIAVRSAIPPDPADAFNKCVALSNATFGFGPGEVSSFSEGGVTVQIVSGTPGSAYTVRMTGPNPNPAPAKPAGPTGKRAAALAKCKKRKSAKARTKCRAKAKKLPV